MKSFLIKYYLSIIPLLLLQFLAFYLLVKLGITKSIDFYIYSLFTTFQKTEFYDFFIAFSYLSATLISLLIFTTISITLLKLQYFNDALWLVLLASISVLGTLFFKYLLQIKRPLHTIHGLTGYSFPSGHVVLSMLLSIFLYLLFSTFARVIICSHWLSNVIASFLAMLLFLSITVVVFENIKKSPMYKKYITQ